jgi:hypothetical protein
MRLSASKEADLHKRLLVFSVVAALLLVLPALAQLVLKPDFVTHLVPERSVREVSRASVRENFDVGKSIRTALT